MGVRGPLGPDAGWARGARGECQGGPAVGGPACPPRPRSRFSLRLVPQTERDVSVRQRAVDLLYAMCDRSNAQQIVAEMLSYLETADYAIREEIVSADGWSGPRGPRPEGSSVVSDSGPQASLRACWALGGRCLRFSF